MQPTKLDCPECRRKFEVLPRPLMVAARKVKPRDKKGEKKPELNDTHRQHLQELVGLEAGDALMQSAVAATPRLFEHSQPFRCPWCQVKLTVMSMVILAKATTQDSEPMFGKSRITKANSLGDRAIELALNAFGEAVREQARLILLRGTKGMPGIPNDMLKSFGRFLRQATPKDIRHNILTQMREEYPGAIFQVWRAEGMVLITQNDELFRFLPAILLEPEPAPPPQQYEVVSLPAQDWVRSRYGYIPAGNHLFMGELRRKNKGAFSKPTQ